MYINFFIFETHAKKYLRIIKIVIWIYMYVFNGTQLFTKTNI